MGFINTDKKRTDPRVFLDREDILDLIEKNVCIYNEQTAFFKLFAFYGMGGIKKPINPQNLSHLFRFKFIAILLSLGNIESGNHTVYIVAH